MARINKPKPHPIARELVFRTTAMTDAMVNAFQAAGLDTSGARLPVKREPSWHVKRRA